MLTRLGLVFHNLKLSYKLTIAISFVCLIALTLFSTTTIMIYKNMMTDKEISSTLTNLDAFRGNLNNYLNGIDKSSVLLIYNPAIQDHLESNADLLNPEARLKAFQDINQKIKEIINNSYGISSIAIMDNYNNAFTFGESSNLLTSTPNGNYRDTAWFTMAVNRDGLYQWEITDWSQSKKTMHMLRSIKSIRNQQTLGVVLFTISPDILKMMFTSDSQMDGIYSIVVSSGEIYSQDESGRQQTIIDTSKMNAAKGHYFTEAGGKTYIVTYSTNPLTNWKFTYTIEQNVLFKDIKYIYFIWVVFFIGSFILISLISLKISKSISGPLKTLTTLNKEVERGNLNVKFLSLYKDEVGILGSSFNRMLDNIREGIPLRREKMLRSILEQNMSKEEFMELNQLTALPLVQPFYQVVLIDFAIDLPAHKLKLMEERMYRYGETSPMVCFTLKPGQYCILFNDSKEETYRITNELIDYYHTQLEISAVGYIGNDYNEIYFVKNSFEEAKELSKYRFFSDSHCMSYEAVMGKVWQTTYPDKLENQLKYYIEQADPVQCRTLVGNLLIFIRDNNIKPFIIHTLLANMYIYLQQLSVKHHVDPQQLFDPRIWQIDLLVDSQGSFQRNFDELIAAIEKYIQAIGGQGTRSLSPAIQKAVSVMEAEYNNYEMGIDFMARILHINSVYFSQLFKKELGTSFMDYLSQIRLGHARRLLGESNLKIKEISKEVGYVDPHYFGIWFKDKTGLTPSQYRNQCT